MFSLRFYILALIFLIFDVELIILFPLLLTRPLIQLSFFISVFLVFFLAAGLFVE